MAHSEVLVEDRRLAEAPVEEARAGVDLRVAVWVRTVSAAAVGSRGLIKRRRGGTH
jgi:hypothetical protein